MKSFWANVLSRRHLPVAGQNPVASRRGFLRVAGAGAAGLVAFPRQSQAAVLAGDRQELARVDSLGLGDILEFEYPSSGDSAFVARLGQSALGGVGEGQDIVAFLRACPHMGCHIQELNVAEAVLGPCGCHRSRFDLSKGGLQIVGRASQNLVQIELEVEDGKLFASGVIGLPYGRALEAQ